MGKYCLYLEAQELNGSITIDEVHDMSIFRYDREIGTDEAGIKR